MVQLWSKREGEMNPLIHHRALYQQLGAHTVSQEQPYRELFHYQLNPGSVDEIHSASNGGFVLGAERFQQEIIHVGRQTWRRSPRRPVKSGKKGEQQN